METFLLLALISTGAWLALLTATPLAAIIQYFINQRNT